MSVVLRREPNQMLVQWTGISQANPGGVGGTADWSDVNGWLIASVDWEGTPGGSSPAFQLLGSNSGAFPPATSTAVGQYSATAAGLIAGSPNSVGAVRPALASGGDGTTNMSCTVEFVR